MALSRIDVLKVRCCEALFGRHWAKTRGELAEALINGCHEAKPFRDCLPPALSSPAFVLPPVDRSFFLMAVVVSAVPCFLFSRRKSHRTVSFVSFLDVIHCFLFVRLPLRSLPRRDTSIKFARESELNYFSHVLRSWPPFSQPTKSIRDY